MPMEWPCCLFISTVVLIFFNLVFVYQSLHIQMRLCLNISLVMALIKARWFTLSCDLVTENGSSLRLLRAGTSTVLKIGSYSASKKSKIPFPRCSLDSNGSKDESSKQDKASLTLATFLFLVCLESCFLNFLLPLAEWESLALPFLCS